MILIIRIEKSKIGKERNLILGYIIKLIIVVESYRSILLRFKNNLELFFYGMEIGEILFISFYVLLVKSCFIGYKFSYSWVSVEWIFVGIFS